MTFDVPTAVLVGGVLTALGGVTSWVARTVVLDRITKLEESRDGMGKRFGDGLAEIKSWQRAHDAVEQDRRRRP